MSTSDKSHLPVFFASHVLVWQAPQPSASLLHHPQASRTSIVPTADGAQQAAARTGATGSNDTTHWHSTRRQLWQTACAERWQHDGKKGMVA